MRLTHKLTKVIDKLAKEAGYPYQKLSHSTYYNILVKAHNIVYKPKNISKT